MKHHIDTTKYIEDFLAKGGTIKVIPRTKKTMTASQMEKAVRTPRVTRKQFAGIPSILVAQELGAKELQSVG